MMNHRAASVLIGLSLGCGSAGSSAGPSTSPSAIQTQATSPTTGSGQETDISRAAPLPTLSLAESKKRADAAWQRADSQKTNRDAWEQAGEALALAAQASSDDPAVAAPLLRGALAAWSNGENLKKAESVQIGKRVPQTLPRRESLRIAVLVQLAALTESQDPELAWIIYRHGRVLWQHSHYKKAAAQFLIVVERFPDKPEAEFAGSLLLDSLLQSDNHKGLEIYARKMLKNEALVRAHPGLVGTLRMVRHQGGKSDASRLVEDESYGACAEAYLTLHERDKDMSSVSGGELLYNASLCLERSDQKGRAIKALQQLLKLYPQSQFAAGSMERVKSLAASTAKE